MRYLSSEELEETKDKEFSVFLRSHFKELDATALFTLLGSTCQKHNESAQEFVIRLMSLRQKVLFISKEDSYQYDQRLVQKRFVHALLTAIKEINYLDKCEKRRCA